jgi:RNA polymerase sigma factor (sigma-70 family)
VRKNSLQFQDVLENEKWLITYMIQKLHIYRNQDEFVQEGLIGLWEAYERFDDGRGFAFRTFAAQTIRGKLLTHLKKSKKHDDYKATLTDAVIEITEDEQSINPLEYEQFMGYCTGLSEDQRRWAVKHFIEGKGPKMIAAEEQVSVEKVKAWRKYALTKLKRNAERMLR